MDFTNFLENCEDITSYTKNYLAVGFQLDYVDAHGELSNYRPDFLVKKSPTEVYVIETKGREELNLPEKMKRLQQWCEDVNKGQSAVTYGFVYVDEESFAKYRPRDFATLISGFLEYQGGATTTD